MIFDRLRISLDQSGTLFFAFCLFSTSRSCVSSGWCVCVLQSIPFIDFVPSKYLKSSFLTCKIIFTRSLLKDLENHESNLKIVSYSWQIIELKRLICQTQGFQIIISHIELFMGLTPYEINPSTSFIYSFS